MKIKIKRDTGFADRLRAYKIVLDGKLIGEIKKAQELTFEVPKGSHNLYLKIDWCRSNIINFDTNDINAVFECGSNLRGLKSFLLIFYITFFRDKYIWLKKIK